MHTCMILVAVVIGLMLLQLPRALEGCLSCWLFHWWANTLCFSLQAPKKQVTCCKAQTPHPGRILAPDLTDSHQSGLNPRP